MFITDDCEAEKNALKTVWPESRQLLCIFHYLQSWWRWLWDSTHDIPNEKRRPIMNIIRSLVYITSEKDLGKSYEDLTNPDIPNSFVNQYPNLQKHLQSFWKRRSEWALSHRVWDLTRGNHPIFRSIYNLFGREDLSGHYPIGFGISQEGIIQTTMPKQA